VTHVHLSSRGTDGRPVPALTREDARRFEAIWTRQVERAFGLNGSRRPRATPPSNEASITSARSGPEPRHAFSPSTATGSRAR
jgi:hypothetical protein